jgi:alanine racemase
LTDNAPVRLRLNSEALVANWRVLDKASGYACAGAAVKANGYGLGAATVAEKLAGAGCRDFFVAHWAEAAALSSVIPASQISVLNGLGPHDLDIAQQTGAIPVLNSPDQARLWQSINGGRCHVMIDSGMNRLGIGLEQMGDVDFSGLDIDILMSHLASADEDTMQNESQLTSFLNASSAVQAQRRSLANSAGILLGDQYHFDLTRPGLALYGGVPRADMAAMLQQVVFPQAEVLQIRQLPAGSPVGYNATYRAEKAIAVATIAIGYADGYPRGLTNIGRCHRGGVILPVIGRVSMDLVTIDISAAPELRVGDFVDVDFDLVNAAKNSGRSQYELLTGLGHRANRIWD